ncbi:MAG: DUF5110 domain-containing protein [Bacteroidales bacterium]|nr:DUF5110 domain-containing protein [Bacteroidales bacterium]
MLKPLATACGLLMGSVWVYAIEPSSYEYVTPEGRQITVTVMSPRVVKVTNAMPGDEPVASASVIAKPTLFDGTVSQEGDLNIITTSAGVVTTIDGVTGQLTITSKTGAAIADSGLRPTANNERTLKLDLDGRCSFYGAGERGYHLNMAGDTLVMYNKQNYGYTKGEPRIKQMNISMPWIISSQGYAILFDDYAAAEMILGEDCITYISEAPHDFAYYFVDGAGSLPEVVKEYTALTGRQDLPPFWSMGYITSKYGYRTQKETLGVIDSLKRAGYPVDGIVLDLYWYGQEQDMGRLEWEPSQWPDHQGMLRQLKDQNVNMVIISQPYVLRNGRAIDNYNALAPQGLFVADTTGAPLEVKIWVGEGGMFDVSNPATRRWLRERYRLLTDEGVAGWWGDLGEPEVHPDGAIHSNGLTTRQYHNQYGNDWSSIIYELFQEEYPDTRLMTMMRGGTAGLQRYSVFPWSTDVSRSWGGLQPQITIMLNSGLSGLGYMSHDVGGFAVDPEHPVDPELYVRWLQLGTFSPILRTHATVDAEPYKYPDLQDVILPLIRTRYQWLPYNYTLAYENASQGLPLVRPLNFYTPGSSALDDIDDQYLWGRDVMIAPVVERGQLQRRIVFPEGQWVDYSNPEKVYQGGDTITYPAPLSVLPIFVRAGSFIPQANYAMNSTADYTTSRYTLRYFPVEGVESQYTLYEDDRKNTRSLQSNEYSLITFEGSESSASINISVRRQGIYRGAPAVKDLTFQIERVMKAPRTISLGGQTLSPEDWTYDPSYHQLIIKTTWDVADPLTLVIAK